MYFEKVKSRILNADKYENDALNGIKRILNGLRTDYLLLFDDVLIPLNNDEKRILLSMFNNKVSEFTLNKKQNILNRL